MARSSPSWPSSPVTATISCWSDDLLPGLPGDDPLVGDVGGRLRNVGGVLLTGGFGGDVTASFEDARAGGGDDSLAGGTGNDTLVGDFAGDVLPDELAPRRLLV